eukprot:scaffold256560_cov38-Tisochrysis_lutea.AAC.2
MGGHEPTSPPLLSTPPLAPAALALGGRNHPPSWLLAPSMLDSLPGAYCLADLLSSQATLVRGSTPTNSHNSMRTYKAAQGRKP